MIKAICTLLILLSTSLLFGQNIILERNTNPKVRDLKHTLNETRDTLIMSCKNAIIKVDIFNEDYEKIVVVENLEVYIPLNDLPAGRFVVEAQLSDKIVLMHLVRPDYPKVTSNSNLTQIEKELTDGNSMNSSGNQNTSPYNIESLLSGRKSKKAYNENKKFYWTLAIVNSGNTSSKTMRLANQTTVDQMINKHQLEIKTYNARHNKLIIWEVFDKTKFLEQQFINPEYINSSASTYFDVSPYYTSENNFE
jgi:hypothetical protein